MNSIVTARSNQKGRPKGLWAAELKLPELTPGGASADVSYLELIRIVRTIRKIGELASNKGLVAEHPYLVGDLAQTLAQYPSITRAVLQRGMKEVALDNAARIRDSVDAS
jgi:hypothetical protein